VTRTGLLMEGECTQKAFPRVRLWPARTASQFPHHTFPATPPFPRLQVGYKIPLAPNTLV